MMMMLCYENIEFARTTGLVLYSEYSIYSYVRWREERKTKAEYSTYRTVTKMHHALFNSVRTYLRTWYQRSDVLKYEI